LRQIRRRSTIDFVHLRGAVTVQKLVHVGSSRVDEETTATLLSLSVCAMTRTCPARLTASLELLRPLAAQVVIAVDERVGSDVDELAPVADEIIVFPHRDPGDSVIPWLHSQCSGRWILNIDDDEVPSSRLLLRLPELLAGDVTHWWLPRRWLAGGLDRYLDEPPWVPDYQLRLYRNDVATLRFSDEFHRPVVVSGQAGFAREPLWHLDCVLNSFERRREKALAYERARRGMRVAGIAHNAGFYLPELLPEARTARVPAADVRLIRGVLDHPLRSFRVGRSPVRRASRAEIDRLWPGEPYDESLYRARLTRIETLGRLAAGAKHTVTVAVANRSNTVWRYGPDAAPAVFVGTRWFDDSGVLLEHGPHTPLPADLRPGCSLDVPVHVRAPEQPGCFRLSIDLVHEHVRWFNQPLNCAVEVRPACRVAVIGRGEPLDRALDQIQLEPWVEPVIVEQDTATASERYGHRCIPDLGEYLLAGIDDRIGAVQLAQLVARTARLLRRARRLRVGKPTAPLPRGAEDCLRGLASCARLHVVGADWPPDAAVTRQLWRVASLAAAARRLDVAVEVDPGALSAAEGRDRLLVRLLR
jgi:hypothetical protein